MNIHYISKSLIPSKTANSLNVMKMCQAFARSGHEVTLYAQEGISMTYEKIFTYYGVEDSFNIIRFKRPSFKGLLEGLAYTYNIVRVLRTNPLPDLFYGRYSYSMAGVAHLGIPLIYEAHTPPNGSLRWKVEEWLCRRRNFLRLVVISEQLRQEYLRIFPWLPSERVRVAHDGADMPMKTGNSPFCKVFPGDAGNLQVGYVGHLYPGKGMEIITLLAHRLPRMDFHVVGGMDEDIARWRQTGATPNLHFHGFVPHADLPWYFEKFDVLLAPYQKKVIGVGGKKDNAPWMSPLKLFEYMASGKAIVCSDLPVLREILSHKEDALLIPPEDIEAWVLALRTLQDDPVLREMLAISAKKKFLACHTWEKRAREVL
jgi:glycosyltransferase involved in cell wall biosynthesis